MLLIYVVLCMVDALDFALFLLDADTVQGTKGEFDLAVGSAVADSGNLQRVIWIVCDARRDPSAGV